MIVTIDGPTASGKSSVAQEVAQRLGFYYLNSGLLYRVLAYLLIEHRNYNKEQVQNPKIKDLEYFLNPKMLLYTFDSVLGSRVYFDGTDITSHLKDKRIDQVASIVSSNKNVRHMLIGVQRSIGRGNDSVADGRDMGSVIFPDADFKFFLAADLEIRAQRWAADQKKRGNNVTLESAIAQLKERDTRDETRDVAPLVVPESAIVIDSSDMTFEQVVEKVIECIEK